MELFLSIGFLVSVLAGLYGLYRFHERKRERIFEYLADAGFNPRYIWLPTESSNGLAIDPDNEGVAILRIGGLEPVLLDYSEVISVEMIVDKQSIQKTVQKTNRGSQIVGLAVGGLVLGGKGAVIGGLSGSRRSTSSSSEKVVRRSLIILTSDMDMPSAEVRFGQWAETAFYDWYGRLSSIVKLSERMD